MNLERHELIVGESSVSESRPNTSWVTTHHKVKSCIISGEHWNVTLAMSEDGDVRVAIVDQLNGLARSNVRIQKELVQEEELKLRLPSPARLERERNIPRDESIQMYESEEDDATLIDDTVMNESATPTAAAPKASEEESELIRLAQSTNDVHASQPQITRTPMTPGTAGLAYGIDPKHIRVTSDTDSVVSALSMPGADTKNGSLIRAVLENLYGANNIKFSSGIHVRKAKIYATRKATGFNNISEVTIFLAGRHTKKMMKSPLDLKQGDVIKMSLPVDAPTPGKEEERQDNILLLKSVYNCMTSVIGA